MRVFDEAQRKENVKKCVFSTKIQELYGSINLVDGTHSPESFTREGAGFALICRPTCGTVFHSYGSRGVEGYTGAFFNRPLQDFLSRGW